MVRRPKDPNWDEEASRNAEIIAREIGSLKESHWPLFSQPDYKSFFAHAKEINELFKTLKPIKREDREQLWNDFSDYCDQIRQYQENERFEREVKSKQQREIILRFIREARTSVKVANDRDDIQRARDEFAKVHEWIGEYSKELLREDRQFCWELLKEGERELHYRIEELQGYAYSEARKAVSDARSALRKDDPYEALAEVKTARARTKGLYLSKAQAQFIYGEFDDIWESVIAKIEEHKREKQRKREEKERKHEQWLRRQQAHIQRWEEQVQKSEEYIHRLEDQINELEYKLSNARTSEYADRISQWISEKHEKISDVESQVHELRKKIRDVRDKIY